MKAALGEGGALVMKSIDRFGHSYEEIIVQRRDIAKARGADVVVLDMPLLDTRELPGNRHHEVRGCTEAQSAHLDLRQVTVREPGKDWPQKMRWSSENA